MTPDAFEALRAAIREDIAASERRILKVIEGTTGSLQREMEALERRLDTRLETVERRLDNLIPVVVSLDQRMAAMLRQHDGLLQETGAARATQAAQQRAIDDLSSRVSRLEERLGR